MAFEDLESVVDDTVIDMLGNADVSINAGPTVRGIFVEQPDQALGMVDALAPNVTVATAAAVGVEQEDAVVIGGHRSYRVIGVDSRGRLTTLRLA